MCENGVSLYLEDADCNSETLLSKINELLADGNKLAQMQAKTKDLLKNNPTNEIVKQLKSII